MTQECKTCGHTPAFCCLSSKYVQDSVNLGGVTAPYGQLLPQEVIERIVKLVALLREDHRIPQATEVLAIFDLCEEAFAAEFDAGYAHAQQTIGEWFEPPEY